MALLEKDGVPPAELAVDATYAILQQMLPGETQDATKLEMGRSYEEVDSGKVAPRAPGAAPTRRERAMAGGVVGSITERAKRLKFW